MTDTVERLEFLARQDAQAAANAACCGSHWYEYYGDALASRQRGEALPIRAGLYSVVNVVLCRFW
jgi:hypothetical protein